MGGLEYWGVNYIQRHQEFVKNIQKAFVMIACYYVQSIKQIASYSVQKRLNYKTLLCNLSKSSLHSLFIYFLGYAERKKQAKFSIVYMIKKKEEHENGLVCNCSLD